MLADEKAFEEVLSLHLGLLGVYRGCYIDADSAGLGGVFRRGHADYTLEHAL